MADVDLVILVDEKRRADIAEIAATLAGMGCRIQSTLPRFRTIVCTAEDSLVGKLADTDGVEMVRPEGSFQLPPIDEDTPQ